MSDKKPQQIPWGIVAAVASTISLGALVYYYYQGREIGAERARLLRERGALTLAIADDYGALRGRVEPWTVAAATQPYAGDFVDQDARSLSFRERPTVYLRIRVGDASNNEAVHANAKLASLDGLSACLLRTKGAGPWAYGEVITRAEMLGADWAKDVRETRNDLRLRNLAYALEQYKEKDFPIARDASKLAEYAIIVLDEDPAQIPAQSAVFGPDASIAQKIMPTEHAIRLYVRRLGDGRELLRIRRTPDAAVVQVQGDPSAGAAGLELRKSQAMGCAMANEALELAGKKPGTEMVANPGPIPVLAPPTPSASASAAPSASTSASK